MMILNSPTCWVPLTNIQVSEVAEQLQRSCVWIEQHGDAQLGPQATLPLPPPQGDEQSGLATFAQELRDVRSGPT